MTLRYDLFWSFRSPYSYFVTERLVTLEREYDVACDVRLVYPIAVRSPEFFQRNDPLWERYFMKDVFRTAEFLGLPFRWARPDPVQRDMKTGLYPSEQPHIRRLSRLGVAATLRGRGLAFIDEVSRLIWSGTTENWHLGDHLARAAERAGLDLAEMDEAVSADGERFEAIIQENQQAQRAAGHYGVPLMAFEGEPFFGQDRFDMLKWRLLQRGMQRKAGLPLPG